MSGDVDVDVDVVVVGAGIIGMACAWRIAQRGATVTVVDPAPGGGASHVAAGMLAPVTEAHHGEEALLALNLDSARRWPAFAADLADASGQPVDFEADATVVVAYDNDDRVALDALGAWLERLDLAVRRLRSGELRTLEPRLAPGVRAGLAADGDHRVDPRTVTAALIEACRRAGARFVASSVSGVACDAVGDGAGRRVRGVDLADGQTLAAATVVLATGAATADFAGLDPAERAPIRPVKGQILTVRCPPGEALLRRAVRGLVHGAGVYLVPRPDGRIVIGATVEEQGWDDRPTVGAVYELLRDASLLVPAISECELLETLVGFRPATPDNGPIIGFSAVTSGLVHAVGHYRNGVLLAPVTADAVADLVVAGRTATDIAPFALSRFHRADAGEPTPAGRR